MKVKLLTYICSGDIPTEDCHAAPFIKKIDSLFDIFNRSSLLDSKLFKCALKEDSPSLYYYIYIYIYIYKNDAIFIQPPCIKC